MRSRKHNPDANLSDAARVVETVLRKKGEIDVSAIRSIPAVSSNLDVEAILGKLRSKMNISTVRRANRDSPILRWDYVVTVEPSTEKQSAR
jgi:hypothetical protein